ncbi:Uncharacterised protein [Mycobacteroides abscessus subsp. abscessus]|nr:Uncharacterised protein [Mycobacteroides abscessus subsp. abscessus]
MKEMQPNLTEQEIKNMYDLCLSDQGQALNAMLSTKNNEQNAMKVELSHRQYVITTVI